MKQTVHILATVRKPELLPAAKLVFQTLRVGFPTAEVHVWGNGLDPASAAAIAAHMNNWDGGTFTNLPATSHDCWIEGLLARSFDPFWICDTDIVFWEPVEDWFSNDSHDSGLSGTLFAGRFEPEFDEEWTQTRHVARLHTSLMWFNTAPLRAAMRAWICQVPVPWRNSARYPFIHQHFIPVRDGRTLFYDSCAGLYHALGGQPFIEPQNEAFEHLHCATYADLIGPALKDADGLQAAHAAIYANPELARGMRAVQDNYYQKRSCPTNLPAVA